MDIIAQFELLSEAAQLAVLGAGFWVVAALCSVMERLRTRRRSAARLEQLERVGWVPWPTLFVLCMIIGGGCLALSLPVVMGRI